LRTDSPIGTLIDAIAFGSRRKELVGQINDLGGDEYSSYCTVAKRPTLKYCMRIQLKQGITLVSTTAATAPAPYERMAIRIQKIINAPTAQKSRSALIFRLTDELEEDWNQLLEEIAENDNVTLAWRDDGGVQIFWTVPKED
jgi:hypothetical protein